MSTGSQAERDVEVWGQLVEAHSTFLAASAAFFAEGTDRVSLVREALHLGRDKLTACHVLRQMKPRELEALFDVLVEWASTGHAMVHVFREAIVSLPRDWVLERIEGAAEPYLRTGTYDEYRRFLELYRELDDKLALKLARRAAAHPDEDIREAGEDFLEILSWCCIRKP